MKVFEVFSLLLLVTAAGQDELRAHADARKHTGKCLTSDNEIVTRSFPSIPLSLHPDFALDVNVYGVGGRKSSLLECVNQDSRTDMAGWNWTRGRTTPQCKTKCQAPTCFADFSFMSLQYGTSPFGKRTCSGGCKLPANLETLDSLVITQNVSWAWTDTAPGVDPPETSLNDKRRVRFIYDFFLTSSKPTGTNIAKTITDEVTINVASNPDFPGGQPPGCLDPGRFSNKSTWGPLVRDAVWDGYYSYDYYWTDHHDAVPGTGSRYSSFRRKGADSVGAAVPSHIDLRPFVDAIKKMWPGEQVGPWLGHVDIGTEVYDHGTGHVNFHGAPKFKLLPASQPEGNLLYV